MLESSAGPGEVGLRYYHRRSGRRSARAISDERLLAKIEEVHTGAYHAYGSQRT